MTFLKDALLKLPMSRLHFVGKERKAFYLLHQWSGFYFGFLFYVIMLSGTVLVFNAEIQRWLSPRVVATGGQDVQGLDKALKRAMVGMQDKDITRVRFSEVTPTIWRVSIRYKNQGRPYQKIIDYTAHKWQIIAQSDGPRGTLEPPVYSGVFVHFLEDLHFRLLLPGMVGFLATGLIGTLLFVMIVTGFFIYRNAFKKFFSFHLNRNKPVVGHRDRHVLAGLWNTPFLVIMTLTGIFFSLGTGVLLPAIATISTGGDQKAFIEEILATPPAFDASPAKMTSLGDVLTRLKQSHPAELRSLSVERWGQKDAYISALMDSPTSEFSGEVIIFDGPSGALLTRKPVIGAVDSVGNDFYGLSEGLHFGDFSGLPSKILWFILGLSSCYIVYTGLRLHVQRQKDPQRIALYHRVLFGSFVGIPLALFATAGATVVTASEFYVNSVFLGSVALFIYGSLKVRSLLRLKRMAVFLLLFLIVSFGVMRWWMLKDYTHVKSLILNGQGEGLLVILLPIVVFYGYRALSLWREKR